MSKTEGGLPEKAKAHRAGHPDNITSMWSFEQRTTVARWM